MKNIIINFLNAILVFLASWLVLWILFLAVMSLKRAKDEGKLQEGSTVFYLGMAVLFIGYLVDFLINIGPATILFFELPTEKTVTERCSRHKNEPGYRGNVARWMCSNLLDPFQIGGHCH